jgi:hypothetical protein
MHTLSSISYRGYSELNRNIYVITMNWCGSVELGCVWPSATFGPLGDTQFHRSGYHKTDLKLIVILFTLTHRQNNICSDI